MITAPGFEYHPGHLVEAEAERLLRTLWDELPWAQYELRLFGRLVAQPRLTGWCSDPGVCYRYSGLTLPSTAWHKELDQLRHTLNARLGSSFNSVLANAYRDGSDSMGWHADNEPELGPEPTIASLSLGAERRFLVRPVSGGSSQGIDLQSGSLLVMGGRSQLDWQHCVPKTKKSRGLRINLTFRRIYPG